MEMGGKKDRWAGASVDVRTCEKDRWPGASVDVRTCAGGVGATERLEIGGEKDQ